MQELPKKKQLFNPAAAGLVDDAGRDGQVVVNKIGRVGAVGQDPAHPGGGQEDVVRPFPLEEAGRLTLVPQVQLPAGAGNQAGAACFFQAAQDGRADQAPMAGNIDFAGSLHCTCNPP